MAFNPQRKEQIKKYIHELFDNFDQDNTFAILDEDTKQAVNKNTQQIFQDLTKHLENPYMLFLLDTVFSAGALLGADQTQTKNPANSPDSDLQFTVTLTPLTKKMLTRIVESGLEPTPNQIINNAIAEQYHLACIHFADALLFYDITMAMAVAMDKIYGTSKVQHVNANMGTRDEVAKRAEEQAAHQIYLIKGDWETVNRFILQRKMANDKRQIISEITNNNPDTETDESAESSESAAKETHKIDIH